MRKLTSLLSLIFLSSTVTFAQSVQNFSVDEQSIFKGYTTQKIWLQHFAMPSVQLEQTVYKQAANLPEEIKTLPKEMMVALGMERKRPFALVSIPAYTTDPNGEIRQLQSYSLNIEEKEEKHPQISLKKTSVSESVLATGDWYKISVQEKGIYKIDYDFIGSLGLDPTQIDTRNIRIYGNGGAIMPENNAIPMPDDLIENAIEVQDGGDNKFDPGDYVLFYANGPLSWVADAQKKTFYHQNNIYEDHSYYFLNFDKGNGLRINTESGTGTPNITAASYDNYQVYEKDLVSVSKFGKRWWGEDFGIDAGRQSSRIFNFNTSISDSTTFRFSLGSVSLQGSAQFAVKINGMPVTSYTIPGTHNKDEYPMKSTTGEGRFPVNNATAEVQLDYITNDYDARGYLDYIEVVTRRPLSLSNGMLAFRDWRTVGAGNIAAFPIQSSNGNTVVWDITQPLQPVRVTGNLSGNTYTIVRDAAILREYIAFDGSRFLAPEFIEKLEPQNLHGTEAVDYIIVTHPDFWEAANKLADFHRQTNSLRVVVVTTEQVYNEFNSGSQDIGAIRDFARMLYNNAGADTADMPRYLLLFGDASYDYKNRLPQNSNFVPTYETAESDDAIYGYCSDDFFAFLDDHENIEGDVVNTMDLGVGRLPVNTPDAANKLVDKIIKYTSPESLGPWRLSTTIMADDGDLNYHFDDGEAMARTINTHTNLYNENKVYVSALPTVSTPGGLRCPDANTAINNQVSTQGTFLMNYNGHGSPTTLAKERILTQDDFNTWKNANHLPVMVTATCTFSKYDDPALASAGELLMVKPDGGAIALLTTTQLVFQYANRDININFLNTFFQKYKGKWLSFGDAFRMSKNITYAIPGHDLRDLANYRKFVLLGDPALVASFPKYNVQTDAITDGYTQLPADTLKALGKYGISGSITDENGDLLSDFNGRVFVTIYDKPRTKNTLTGPARTFTVQNNVIYKGNATVSNGVFTFSFIAPKDINYDMGKGKISYYAENGITDAAGADTTLSVGGFSEVVFEDEDAPVVKPFMNDSLFKDGGITGTNSMLYVQLFDESGINVSGNSIGHDLTAVLDEDVANPYILNDYYETAPNDYTRGYVSFPLAGLSDGKHTLRVKAWDMFNNSGEGTVHFEVINGEIFTIKNLMNYPNPFNDKTRFVFEHNHPGEDLKAQIRIYSTAGRLVRTLEEDFTPPGSRSHEIIWDGTDNNGAKLPAGLYVYKLNLSDKKGIQATAYQKLVLIR